MTTFNGTVYPDATNTGVLSGVTLTPHAGDLVINTPGAVISGLDITGTVYINAPNVTLENCKVTSTDWSVVNISGVTGTIIQDCTISGTGNGPAGQGGISGTGTFLRNDISGTSDGIQVVGSNTVVQDNYIHDLQASGTESHYDGIQLDGGFNNVTIEHNTVIGRDTSCVMITNDFGGMDNIVVDKNLLLGQNDAAATIYVYEKANLPGQITDVQVTNNALGKGQWYWGDIQLTEPVWTNNVDYATGKIVSADGTLSSAPVTQPATQPSAPSVPAIASFSNDSGVAGDKITNDNTLELKGTAAAGSTVKIYDGSTQIGSTTATSTGAWDYISQVLTDAKHTLTATATNSSGTSAASAALAVTVDTKVAAPTITNDTVNSVNQVVASGTAEANSAIKVYDGTTQVGTATTDSSGAWTVTTAALAAGTHALTAKATDIAGNVSAASATFDPVIGSSGSPGTGTSGTGTSGSGAPAPTPPAAPKIASFSTDSGVAGDHITSDKTLTLAGSAAANSTVKVFDGATQLGSVTADASGAWHYSTAALPDGKHSFTATDTVSGVISKASTALDVTVDSAAPAAPVLLSDPTTHNRATVSGTAEAGSSIKLYEGTTLLGTATVASDGDWSVTTPNLKHGSHTFTATATDAAGNTSALSQPIDPPIGSHGANGTSTVEVTNVRQHWDHTATIKGIADPNSQIKLSDGTTSAGSVTAGADGKWSFHTSDLSGKSHAFTAEQVDTTGHVVGTSSGEAIIGSGRSNTLTGTTGNDVMVGKAGADTFVFASNFGHDVIKDFAAGGPAHDTIQFSKGVFDSFASVLSHAAQSGGDVVLATGSDTLTLKNTKLDALTSHDFHFA